VPPYTSFTNPYKHHHDDLFTQKSPGKRAILLVNKHIYSEVSHWLYKNIRLVRFYGCGDLAEFAANRTRMGPLENRPRIEFLAGVDTSLSNSEELARIVAEEALMQLQKLSTACRIYTRKEFDESEPEPQWTARLEKGTERRGCVFRTVWKVALLPRDSLESGRPQRES
jgi:hypothetical protein